MINMSYVLKLTRIFLLINFLVIYFNFDIKLNHKYKYSLVQFIFIIFALKYLIISNKTNNTININYQMTYMKIIYKKMLIIIINKYNYTLFMSKDKVNQKYYKIYIQSMFQLYIINFSYLLNYY